ncbi:MAG: gamma-glutamyltransferase [Prochloraceae cyanobacterium]|nr:gamma-glutamyltransferase [Prochloraceae cyanobacterium]
MSRVIISSGSQISADGGAAIAARGGNAVDAALAAVLVSMCTDLGVMAPGASGFITIWPPKDNPVVIDAYAEIPGRGKTSPRCGQGMKEVKFDYGGMMNTGIGYGSVATPGIFAGMEMACEQYGNLTWAEVMAPALKWVEQGFPLTGGAAEYLLYTHKAIFSWHRESYQTLHHPDGSCLREGEIVSIPDLANSLQLIAEGGADIFYSGEIGERMVAEIQEGGGLLTAADLKAYRAIARAPICIRFGDWEIATNPAPAIGGATLAAMLLLLDGQPFPKWNLEGVRQMVKIQQAVLNYRNQHLETASNSSIATEINRLLELAGNGNFHDLLKSPSTIHISAVDSDGLACSITASAGYGSGVMISGTGLWLNNSLGEIELHPQGLQGLAPGTRLPSNMAPTIAKHDDGTILAIGSPGASRITTAIVQVLLNFIHLGMSLEEAIASPRLHVEVFQNAPTVSFEAGLNVDELTGFTTRSFPQLSMYFGGVQAALVKPDLSFLAVADPRRTGGIAESNTPNKLDA